MRSSHPTFSFFVLVAMAAIASFGALYLTSHLSPKEDVQSTILKKSPATSDNVVTPPDQKPAAINIDTNTDSWQEYTDPTYFLSFKHPNDWDVQTFPDKAGYYVIAVRPKQGTDSIRVYVSPDHYSGLAGLPSKKDNLAGIQSVNVNDETIGVRYSTQYYTFDMGTDIRIQPAFKAMLTTVAFSK